MIQIVIAKHISSGQEHEFTIEQWKTRAGMTNEDGTKVYQFIGTRNERTAPVARSTQLKGSTGGKRGCGCRK